MIVRKTTVIGIAFVAFYLVLLGGICEAVEVAIPLASFGIRLESETTIGLNVQLNDDDDGGIWDHKLSWSKVELTGNNASFKDPAVFGELRLSFAEDSKAVISKMLTLIDLVSKEGAT